MEAFTYLLGRQWFSKVLNYIQIQSTVTGLHILMSELRPYIFDGPSSNDWPQSEKETNFVPLLFMTCFLLPSYLSFTLLFLSFLSIFYTHIYIWTLFFFLRFIFSKEFKLCNKRRIFNFVYKKRKEYMVSNNLKCAIVHRNSACPS